jgi:hypothetical protein
MKKLLPSLLGIAACFSLVPSARAACHTAESGLLTLDTRTSTEVNYDPLPDPAVGEPPITQAQLSAPAHDASADRADLVLEVPTAGTKVVIKKSTTLADAGEVIGTLDTPSQRVNITDPEATQDKAFYWAEYTEMNPHTIGFIDERCNGSDPSAVGDDSDNYFIHRNNDHLGLEIHYKLPTDLNITDVRFVVYIGDTNEKMIFNGQNYLPGKKTGSAFTTGPHMMITWDAEPAPSPSHPCFYRIQMQVCVNGETTSCYKSPINDSDGSAVNGWQCPNQGLAVYDPVRRHRPILHVGTATGGTEYPIHPYSFLKDSQLYRKETSYNETLIYASPTIADLMANNTPQHFLDIPPVDALTGYTAVTGGPIYNPGNPGAANYADPTVMFTVSHPVDRNTSVGDNFIFLQYWFFYNFSNSAWDPVPNPYHEGDVEFVQVAVKLFEKDPDYPAFSKFKEKWMQPFGATASQHYYGQTLGWNLKDGSINSATSISTVGHDGRGRPHVYAAQGTHATYFAPARYKAALESLGTEIQWEVAVAALSFEEAVTGHAIAYTLIPCPDFFLQWQGRWGRIGSPEASSYLDGPPGPLTRSAKYENGTSLNLWKRPIEFHNACIRGGWESLQAITE